MLALHRLLPALLALVAALVFAAPPGAASVRQGGPASTVIPTQAYTDTPTPITIVTSEVSFTSDPAVRMFTCAPDSGPEWRTEAVLTDVRRIDDNTLEATVPAGLSEGIYSFVLTVDGQEHLPLNTALTLMRRGDGRPGPWTRTSTPPVRLVEFSATAAAGQIYLVGGRSSLGNNPVTTVLRATIQADGSLGPWQSEPALLTGRARPALAATSAYLYAIGGDISNGPTPRATASIERAPIRPDGGLGPWEQVAPLPAPRLNLAAVVASDQLYVLGGVGSDDLRNSAFAAAIQPNGGLGPWRVVDGPPLRQATLYPNIHAAAHGDDIYVLNGEGTAVSRSRVRADGGLDPWQIEPSTRTNHRDGALVAAGGALYAIAGFYPCIYGSPIVERADIGPDGALGLWTLVGSTSAGHAFGAAVTWEGRLYAIGGMSGFTGSSPVVEYAALGPPAVAQPLRPSLWLPALSR